MSSSFVFLSFLVDLTEFLAEARSSGLTFGLRLMPRSAASNRDHNHDGMM
jgi:hypothetical protein